MNKYAPKSPDHFAQEGKRIQSANDPDLKGVVTKWIGYHSFLVKWDIGAETACTVFDVEPLED